MNIGFFVSNYPENRCIINKTDNTYIYCNLKKNIWYLLKIFLRKLRVIRRWDVTASIKAPRISDVDVWHTFNSIPETDKPYVITFESAVPRNEETVFRKWEWDSEYKCKPSRETLRLLKLLKKSNCNRLLALSQNAKDVMYYQLQMLGCERDDQVEIMGKVEVLYPPQALNCTKNEIVNKYTRDSRQLKLVFVGNDFFRKGGGMLLSSLGKINKEFLHLTIISSVNVDTIMNTTVEKQARIKQYCEEQPWITLLQNVSNERVLEILKDSHIGFLPTIQDTFGYSVLEMQASGCPVVTTDIRALEEINNDTLGWIIPIRKNCISKESFYHNEMELEIACQQIENELVKILEEIISRWIHGDTSYFIQKAIGCIEHIDRNNNPIKYGERLESIYKESVLETHR